MKTQQKQSVCHINQSMINQQIDQQIDDKNMHIKAQIKQNLIKQKTIKQNPYEKWRKEQDVLYLRFLKSNIQRMKKKYYQKPYNKFQKMSDYIQSKNSLQCRSHHQKMLKKYETIQKIIRNLQIKTSKLQIFNFAIQNDPNNRKIDKATNFIDDPSDNFIIVKANVIKEKIFQKQLQPKYKQNLQNSLKQEEQNDNQVDPSLSQENNSFTVKSKDFQIKNTDIFNKDLNSKQCQKNVNSKKKLYQETQKKHVQIEKGKLIQQIAQTRIYQSSIIRPQFSIFQNKNYPTSSSIIQPMTFSWQNYYHYTMWNQYQLFYRQQQMKRLNSQQLITGNHGINFFIINNTLNLPQNLQITNSQGRNCYTNFMDLKQKQNK